MSFQFPKVAAICLQVVNFTFRISCTCRLSGSFRIVVAVRLLYYFYILLLSFLIFQMFLFIAWKLQLFSLSSCWVTNYLYVDYLHLNNVLLLFFYYNSILTKFPYRVLMITVLDLLKTSSMKTILLITQNKQ